MPAAGAAVAAERHDQGGRSPTERLVRQPPCDRVTRHALATTPAAPAIGIDDPTGQDRPARFQTLARHLQTELIEKAERRQIRGREGSVGQVEVFQLDGVGTSIVGRPRRLSRPRPAHWTYTLHTHDTHTTALT